MLTAKQKIQAAAEKHTKKMAILQAIHKYFDGNPEDADTHEIKIAYGISPKGGVPVTLHLIAHRDISGEWECGFGVEGCGQLKSVTAHQAECIEEQLVDPIGDLGFDFGDAENYE